MRVIILLCLFVSLSAEEPWLDGSIFPKWHQAKATKVIAHHYQAGKSAEQNGLALASAMESLKAGQKLVIERGTYTINKVFNLALQGTPKQPIWIMAAPGHRVVINRKDRSQNVINLASHGKPMSYVCIRGIEFVGGSSIMRIYHCSQLWIDQCYLRDGGNVGISANGVNTDHLFITRNKVENPGPASATAEGMYLGGNNGDVVMHSSVIAFNEVSNCKGTQGDGIEIKEGSYNNWIIGNRVYDCQYPCIIAYGSKGKGINLIEGNICYDSKNHAMQVQGDAIVRNNLIINDKSSAFASRDHQGSVQRLHLINNTFIAQVNAVELRNWNAKSSMIFANNACYSMRGEAVKVVGGHDKAYVNGNMCFGRINGLSGGFKLSKQGLKDFAGITVNAQERDARPAKGFLLGTGDVSVQPAYDLYRLPRSKKYAHVGAVLPRKDGVGELQEKVLKIKLKQFKKDEKDWQREEPGVAWTMEQVRSKKEKIWLLLPPDPKQKK